jgi:hypothetical protein
VVILLGYRLTDGEHAKPIVGLKSTMTLDWFGEGTVATRRVQAVWSGCGLRNVARFWPDDDVPSTIYGALLRMGRSPPRPRQDVFAEFLCFCRDWIRQNLIPLGYDSDVSVESWLESTNYTERRKEELRAKWKEVEWLQNVTRRMLRSKSFRKYEAYESRKAYRMINSRTDEFKCAVAPIFKLIEKVVFQRPEFIKKVPVADRPGYLAEHLAGAKSYYTSDFESFENLFTRDFLDGCELALYEYMSSALPNGKEWITLVRKAMLGRQICDFKCFGLGVDPMRLSGEMCTSLGNGFSNLMIQLFIAQRRGSKIALCVEGDDNIAAVLEGTAPTAEDYESLGLSVKLEKHTTIDTASFCGIVSDADDGVNVCDIRKALADLFWVDRKYAAARPNKLKALLRMKAMSLACQYRGCPVLDAVACRIMELTSGYDVRSVMNQVRDVFQREKYAEALKSWKTNRTPTSDIPAGTRCLVEELYGVSVELQLLIESKVSKMEYGEWSDPAFYEMFPEAWITHASNYVVEGELEDNVIHYPQIQSKATASYADALCELESTGRLRLDREQQRLRSEAH